MDILHNPHTLVMVTMVALTDLENQDIFIRTLVIVPKVSIIYSFHCNIL